MNVRDSNKSIALIYAIIIAFCLFPINSVPLIYLIFENLVSGIYTVRDCIIVGDYLLAAFIVFNSIYTLGFLISIIPVAFIQWFASVKELESLHEMEKRSEKLDYIPNVSVIIPAYNEEKTIIQTILACNKQTWKPSQIIIINDGSTDNTANLIISEFKLWGSTDRGPYEYKLPQKGDIKAIYRKDNIILITKENAGKGYALNLGMEFVTSEITCLFDGDTIAEPEGIKRLAFPMIEDESILLTSGRNQLINKCSLKDGEVVDVNISDNALVLAQTREFLTDLPGKAFENYFNAQMTLVGNFSCYRTSMVYKLNGFAERGLTEDYDYNFDIQGLRDSGKDVKIRSIVTTVGWTQAPFTISGLYRQRLRWATGKLDSTIRHYKTLFNKRLGFLGLFIIPMRWLHALTFPFDFALHFINIPVAIYLYNTSISPYLIEEIFWIYYVPMMVYEIINQFIIHNYFDWKYIRSYNKKSTYILLTFKRLIFDYFYKTIIMCAEIASYWKVIKRSSEWGKSDRETITPL